MNYFPDFTDHGYRIKEELGSNRAGGRVTYLAESMNTQQLVVIKQFQFARTQATWSEFDMHDQEIQVLKDLNHPGIPRYLDSFQNSDGFCMVQEYKNASPLSKSRHFSLTEIQQIAIASLKILVYLQAQTPPVIHRDIKPENILVDDQINVYLVDFGFARVGHGEVGVSSVVKGTLGFMPPEQIFNRQLSEASDLYSLGITLICLLTKTKSDDIGTLIDISYQIKFKHLVPKLSVQWVNWLEKMVEPRLKDRFSDAETALEAIPASQICSPDVRLSQSNLTLTANQVGERLTHVITINNPVSETTLEGIWTVEPHPGDRTVGSKPPTWISFQPERFDSNQVECQITVDTSKLMAEKTYVRKLLLQTNAAAKTYSLTLHVQTAPIPIRAKQLPYRPLILLFLFGMVMAWITAWGAVILGTTTGVPVISALGTAAGVTVGLEVAAWTLATSNYQNGAIASVVSGMVLCVATLLASMTVTSTNVGGGPTASVVVLSGVGLVAGWMLGVAMGIVAETFIRRNLSKPFATIVSLLVVALGVMVGMGSAMDFLGVPILEILRSLTEWSTVGMSFVLAVLLIRLPLQQAQQIASYRKSERHLVQQ
ncbi:MAG TPA: serine/threonine-protein kinase [Crinalium sp.]